MVPPSAEEMLHVRLGLPTGWEETVIFLLQQEGWGAVVGETPFPGGMLQGEAPPPDARVHLTLVLGVEQEQAFAGRVVRLASDLGWSEGEWSLDFELRRKEDWEALWRRRWKPFRCGRFVVHTDFHDLGSLALRPDDRPLRLRAGSAFGTGGHSSTRMALRALQRWFDEGPLPRVLDLGTGSGILAVASALRGAERVLGMDPDPASAAQARATAEANGVAARCRFWRGGLETATGRWHAVYANLHSDLIAENADWLAERALPGCRLFAGGILDRKAERTLRALTAAAWNLDKSRIRGRWVTFEMRFPS